MPHTLWGKKDGKKRSRTKPVPVGIRYDLFFFGLDGVWEDGKYFSFFCSIGVMTDRVQYNTGWQ